jgi:non-specific serine/threonine protein kinase
MSDSKRREILDILEGYPQGQIYTIAPKDYVVRGFDYYRQGKLLQFAWTDDFAFLTARVGGTKLYSVVLSVSGRGLTYTCDCPAWTPYSNCKHVICSLFTIKNLLHPNTFRINNDNEERREILLKELYGGQYSGRTVPVKKDKTHGYSLVIVKEKDISDIYVMDEGKRIEQHHYECPFELREFIQFSYYAIYSKKRALARFLKRYGNKYPIILKSGEEEQVVRFDDTDKCTVKTEIDAHKDSVIVSKVCIRQGKEFRSPDIWEDYVFDPAAGEFAPIAEKSDWQLWKEIRSRFLDFDEDYEISDDIDMYFSMPIEAFQMLQLIFPSSEGDRPLTLMLKSEGREAEVLNSVPSYRLTISPSSEMDLLTLRAQCIVDGIPSPPAFDLFQFLSWTGSGMSSPLYANKRRKILYRVFFDMFTAKTKTDAKNIINKALSNGDFNRYRLKMEARNVLKKHLAIFQKDERQLILHDRQWIFLKIDKARELFLYKIPYEIFGWEIFKEMQSHDAMTVPAEALYRSLPLLYERLKEEKIELFFEQKPVKTSTWDFAFDATRHMAIDWFEIRPEIRCNGELIDEMAWKKIIEGKGAIERDDCIQILDSNCQKIFSAISDIYKTNNEAKDRQREIVGVPRLQILDWITLRNNGVRVKLSSEDEDIISRLARFEKIEIKALPSKLKGRLRQYQKDGYAWLSFLYENRFGACLADDMGLGKTIQAISLLGAIKEGKVRYPGGKDKLPHLIVLPPSLLFNWENEIKKFYPGLKIIFYSGKERNTTFDGYDAVLTTYGLVRRDVEKLRDIPFDVIVFDEAQAIKNIYADTTGAVRQLSGQFKLAMTGTPLENHIGEYYSIIDLAVPGLLGEFQEFKPLIKQEASAALDRIIRRTRPFVLRRTKEKILKELPPKTETDVYLDLTDRQKALYKRTVEQIKSTIDNAFSTKTSAQAQIIALTAILKLRQLCVSPQLLSPEIKEPSPKIDFLIEDLKELLEENHSALVFSQFTSFLDVLEHDLKKHGIGFLRLDGSTQVKKRKNLIEEFQSGEGPSVFLLSLRAGGQGLNLTKASYVFHLDPWWNPAVENQASDRVHRIGQKSKVTIKRILMRHTIEEKMMVLKKKKLDLYKAVMEDSSAGRKGLSITRADFKFLLS